MLFDDQSDKRFKDRLGAQQRESRHRFDDAPKLLVPGCKSVEAIEVAIKTQDMPRNVVDSRRICPRRMMDVYDDRVIRTAVRNQLPCGHTP